MRLLFTCAMFLFQLNLIAQPAYVFHEKGLEKLNNGDFAGAIKDFETALSKDKNDFESYFDRGRAYEQTGKPDLALNDYNAAVKANPDFAKAFYNRGQLFLNKNDDDAAIKDFSKVISLQPTFAPGYIARAKALRKKNKTEEALTDLNKASDLKSKEPELFILRSEIYTAKGKSKEALSDLNTAIGFKPEAGILYAKRGFLLYDLKDLKSAIADFTKAIELRQGTEEVFEKRAKSYQETAAYDAAIKDYSHLLDILKSKKSAYYLNRATCYRLKGDAASALKDLTKYLGIEREDPKALTERGIIYLSQGKSKFPLAATDFRKVIEIKPDMPEPHFYLGKLSFESGKYADAVDQLNTFLKLKEDAEGYYLRSKSHYKLEHKKEVCADLSKAAQLGHKEAKKDLPLMCPTY